MKIRKFSGADLFYAAVAVMAACLVIYVRLRLAQAPLDRDEGEFAYAGQLALQGIPPYSLAYNMKFPGIYWLYALIMAVLGQSDFGIRAGFLLINGAAAFLVFSIGSRLMDRKSGLAAAACFLVVMMAGSLNGLYACAECAVVLFALAGLRVLLHAVDTGQKRWYAAAGIIMGMSIVTRQHGILFFLAGLAYAIYAGKGAGPKKTALNCLLYSVSSPLLPALMAAYVFVSGAWNDFIFWVFTYGTKYVSAVGPREALYLFSGFAGSIFWDSFPILLYALAGVILPFLDRAGRKTAGILPALLAFSLAAVSVGFYFRSHYFIYLMPAISLMCGAASRFFEREGMRPSLKIASRALLVAAIAAVVFINRDLWFKYTPEEATDYSYYENPFADMKKIGAFIRAGTEPKDTVMVLGSEPELYFYSSRHSVSGYIYMYPLMEPQEYAGVMQDRMIKQIEAAKPSYIVYVGIRFSWSERPQSDRRIFQWFGKYQKERYKSVGYADMITPFNTEYSWGKGAAGADYTKPGRITIFQRI